MLGTARRFYEGSRKGPPGGTKLGSSCRSLQPLLSLYLAVDFGSASGIGRAPDAAGTLRLIVVHILSQVLEPSCIFYSEEKIHQSQSNSLKVAIAGQGQAEAQVIEVATDLKLLVVGLICLFRFHIGTVLC